MCRVMWCWGYVVLISVLTGVLTPPLGMAGSHSGGIGIAECHHSIAPELALAYRAEVNEIGKVAVMRSGRFRQTVADNPWQLVAASGFGNSSTGDQRGSKARSGGQFTALATGAMNVFASDMYARIERGEKNLILSPFSVFSPLVVASQGAIGATRKEIEEVLHIDKLGVPVHPTLGKLVRHLKSSTVGDGGQLAVGNGIWVRKFAGYRLRGEFLKTIRDHYDVTVREVDGRKSLSIVAEEINDWVKKVTEERVVRLISPQDLMKEPIWVMSILNAVYYKNAWAECFTPRRTKDEYFTLLDGSRIKVRMMNKDAYQYRYMEESTFQALEIPYRGGNAAMVIFLPWKTRGLAEMERWLTSENLRSSLRKLSFRRQRLKVSIPRFSIRCRLQLASTLRSMGIKRGFSPAQADFTGFFEKKAPGVPKLKSFITLVVHEASVEVTEEGTVAAAATRMDFDKTKPLRRDRQNSFRADHPFMFVIYHIPTNCILFMGRVTRPEPPRPANRSFTR